MTPDEERKLDRILRAARHAPVLSLSYWKSEYVRVRELVIRTTNTEDSAALHSQLVHFQNFIDQCELNAGMNLGE